MSPLFFLQVLKGKVSPPTPNVTQAVMGFPQLADTQKDDIIPYDHSHVSLFEYLVRVFACASVCFPFSAQVSKLSSGLLEHTPDIFGAVAVQKQEIVLLSR